MKAGNEHHLFAADGKLCGFAGPSMFVIDLKKTTVAR
jgi:hypothetical protein